MDNRIYRESLSAKDDDTLETLHRKLSVTTSLLNYQTTLTAKYMRSERAAWSMCFILLAVLLFIFGVKK